MLPNKIFFIVEIFRASTLKVRYNTQKYKWKINISKLGKRSNTINSEFKIFH